jgi:cysteine-rich repeat protein
MRPTLFYPRRLVPWFVSFLVGCFLSLRATCVLAQDEPASQQSVPLCGNGMIEEGEACDGGNTQSKDGCRFDCKKTELCGDGFLDGGEACDDGNILPWDECSPRCALEEKPTPIKSRIGPPAPERSEWLFSARGPKPWQNRFGFGLRLLWLEGFPFPFVELNDALGLTKSLPASERRHLPFIDDRGFKIAAYAVRF